MRQSLNSISSKSWSFFWKLSMSTSNLATSLSRSLRERAKNDTLSPAVVTSENERLEGAG